MIDVPVYRWVLPDDLQPACSLVSALADGGLDAVTFTSAAAISNLFAIAAQAGGDDLVDAVRAALLGPVLPICVGPVSAARLAAHGVDRRVHPARWRLGPMVRCLAEDLSARRRLVRIGGGAAVVQGTAVALGDLVVSLSRREAQVLTALVDAGGAVVPKERLARTVWEPGTDPHVVEVTVARLRRRLGPAGASLQTVPRRGYRMAG